MEGTVLQELEMSNLWKSVQGRGMWPGSANHFFKFVGYLVTVWRYSLN